MKSVEHAVVGAVVSAAAAMLFFSEPNGAEFGGLVVFGVLLSVFVDLDHFLIAREMTGDWRHLERAVTNPRVGLVEQEKVFADTDGAGLQKRRLLSHHLIGGALSFVLLLAGFGSLAAFVAVVLYAHVLCDYLRDIGYA